MYIRRNSVFSFGACDTFAIFSFDFVPMVPLRVCRSTAGTSSINSHVIRRHIQKIRRSWIFHFRIFNPSVIRLSIFPILGFYKIHICFNNHFIISPFSLFRYRHNSAPAFWNEMPQETYLTNWCCFLALSNLSHHLGEDTIQKPWVLPQWLHDIQLR